MSYCMVYVGGGGAIDRSIDLDKLSMGEYLFGVIFHVTV